MMAMASDAFNDRLADAANDRAAQESRERACEVLMEAFGDAGQVLSVGGYLFGPDRAAGVSPFRYGSDATVALGTVCRIASELIEGASGLLRADNLYAASALLRQIVEVEYLTWAFSEDEEEAAAWLRSNHEERMRLWQPRHIPDRSGGRFRGTDYREHCVRGSTWRWNSGRLLINCERSSQACSRYERRFQSCPHRWSPAFGEVCEEVPHRGPISALSIG